MAPSIISNDAIDSAYEDAQKGNAKFKVNRAGDHLNGYSSSPVHLDPAYQIIEQPIGTRRPIRVACMGAGYSGLMMAIMFSETMKDKTAELVIYERNKDLGGTWLENRWASTDILKHSCEVLGSLIAMNIDIPAANAISLPTTTHTALLPTQNGQITTPHHSRSTSICTKLRISTTATNTSSMSIQLSLQSGTRVTPSGRSRCRKKMGLLWKTMLTFSSTLEECSSMVRSNGLIEHDANTISLATGNGQISKVFITSRAN